MTNKGTTMPITAAIAAAQTLIRVRLVSTASGGVRQYDVQYPLNDTGEISLAAPGARTNAPANPSDYWTAQRHARTLRIAAVLAAVTGDDTYANESGYGYLQCADWRCAARQLVREYRDTLEGQCDETAEREGA